MVFNSVLGHYTCCFCVGMFWACRFATMRGVLAVRRSVCLVSVAITFAFVLAVLFGNTFFSLSLSLYIYTHTHTHNGLLWMKMSLDWWFLLLIYALFLALFATLNVVQSLHEKIRTNYLCFLMIPIILFRVSLCYFGRSIRSGFCWMSLFLLKLYQQFGYLINIWTLIIIA